MNSSCVLFWQKKNPPDFIYMLSLIRGLEQNINIRSLFFKIHKMK